ncbi:hypothetical protein BLNAU_14234 [Blattamonas nauphoetae]|uniref:Uncharacterized protein n=1 Tax=Blattamonas nauphoetae TaxID=2049346 RepID=A0ABQ9XKN4_9EUKA|nr:hypothetical protein BLNAU_14234 [Blattamonas nauphoetae]
MPSSTNRTQHTQLPNNQNPRLHILNHPSFHLTPNQPPKNQNPNELGSDRSSTDSSKESETRASPNATQHQSASLLVHHTLRLFSISRLDVLKQMDHDRRWKMLCYCCLWEGGIWKC